MLQATENKVARGNHRKQVLSTPASEVRVPGKWSSQSLELADAEKGSFLFAPAAYQERGNIFPQFVISGLYTMPSRKPTLGNLRESREICCSS